MTVRVLPDLAADLHDSLLEYDLRSGVVRHESGARQVFLPADFLRGLHEGLRYEVGPATDLVLYRCGVAWGTRTADRLWQDAVRKGVVGPGGLTVVDFLQWLREWFRVSGWGDVTFDVRDAEARGVVWVALHFSLVREALHGCAPRADPLLAGALCAFFVRVSGSELATLELPPDDEDVLFAISGRERIEAAEHMVARGGTREDVRRGLLAE